MRRLFVRGTLIAVVAWWVWLAPVFSARSDAQPAPKSVSFTINTPEPHTFELALDEIELDWSARDSSRAALGSPSPVVDTRVTLVREKRAVFAVAAVGSVGALAARGLALEAMNPGTEAYFVLYEPGERSAASRQVLTTRTALLLDDPADPTGALAEYAARNPQPVAGVPGAYTLAASDPLTAVQLAEALRLRAGVTSAYPLLERQVFPR